MTGERGHGKNGEFARYFRGGGGMITWEISKT